MESNNKKKNKMDWLFYFCSPMLSPAQHTAFKNYPISPETPWAYQNEYMGEELAATYRMMPINGALQQQWDITIAGLNLFCFRLDLYLLQGHSP
jgi:hypothetical protein